ncbi:MAG: Zn-dependent exopeptidase M28 [Lentisphaerae bacterium]|jgi:Zn-dependent M28 family amino/carboxypeptidase|nr:Zn-dependent exopeptidase M28 [Lentisphaerota bacterium]
MDKRVLDRVSIENLRHDLFYLCRDPLPFRTVSYTIPWHQKNSLDEADDFIAGEMRKYAAKVEIIPNKVRPFRCDSSKPLHHWYSAPLESDPWYDAQNISVTLPGNEYPDEIIQLVSHKDSMSWINSPGAHDNAVGAVANMELVRVLSALTLKRTVRVLFCNEEHTPWHSKTYANDASKRGDRIIAVMNQDSLCGKSDEARAAGIKTNVSAYSTPEGKALADFIVSEAARYDIPICASAVFKERVNDDDGSFIKAGYPDTVHNLGSLPYGDSQYHLAGDIPERVDLVNLQLAVQLILASILDIDEHGATVFQKPE